MHEVALRTLVFIEIVTQIRRNTYTVISPTYCTVLKYGLSMINDIAFLVIPLGHNSALCAIFYKNSFGKIGFYSIININTSNVGPM